MKTLGLFGPYGGVYVPEALIPALEELETAFLKFSQDDDFLTAFNAQLRDFAGRPTPLFHAKNLSRLWARNGQGAQIWFKREDLLHGGAHKTNNAIGQALLAKAMGKNRIIAETGAGQHGVATAMAGALLGLETVVYMGEVDTERQLQNVNRMKLLGTTVVPVKSGSRTLKDAINEALRDWITNVRTTHYLLGTVAGPHPFPTMVKFFHQMMGDEAKVQFAQMNEGGLPDAVIACVGGGSNAIGIFNAFLDNPSVRLIGVEPAGRGLDTQEHGAVLALGTIGTLHGMKSLLLQDGDGQIHETHSISAGLDYPSVGPEHAYLQQIGRVQYETATDAEAMAAFHICSRNEGILPALETAHALAYAEKLAPTMRNDQHILINLSGRGDKDLQTVLEWDTPNK